MFDLQLDRCELLVREIEEDFEEEGIIEEIMIDCQVDAEDARLIQRGRRMQMKIDSFMKENPLALCVR